MPNRFGKTGFHRKAIVITSCLLGLGIGFFFGIFPEKAKAFIALSHRTTLLTALIALQERNKPLPPPFREESPEPTPSLIPEASIEPSSTLNPALVRIRKASPTPLATASTGTNPNPSPTADPDPSPTSSVAPSPTVTPSPILTTAPTWEIQSVSSMKETKDRVCNQRPRWWVEQWVDKAKALGVNYVAVETPYDSPTCGNAVAYTRMWVQVIRSRGLKVWHRHMPLAFEGIYDVPKNNQADYLAKIISYIKTQPDLFAADDIFTPTPEPQNGGIAGVTYCPESICQFRSKEHFNQWLRGAMSASSQAFYDIGLGGQLKIGYYGFDGFVAWGHQNPDWTGILEDATVEQMGNITIDHYPELVGDTMENSLNELEARYPGVPIIIGEWGTVTTNGSYVSQVHETMATSQRPSVKGFNYWHMGVGGNEALINDDFSTNPQYLTVKSYFSSTSP